MFYVSPEKIDDFISFILLYREIPPMLKVTEDEYSRINDEIPIIITEDGHASLGMAIEGVAWGLFPDNAIFDFLTQMITSFCDCAKTIINDNDFTL